MLYKVASDPKVWERHQNKDRFKREVFEKFFDILFPNWKRKSVQIAEERLGIKKIAEEEAACFGDPMRTNFVYDIKK